MCRAPRVARNLRRCDATFVFELRTRCNSETRGRGRGTETCYLWRCDATLAWLFELRTQCNREAGVCYLWRCVAAFVGLPRL